MKKIFVVFLFTACVCFLHDTAFAQKYFVILGTFENEENATAFKNRASSKIPNLKSRFIAARQVYYVYGLETFDHEEARRETSRLRAASSFSDAWTFTDESFAAEKKEPVAVEQPPVVLKDEPAPVAITSVAETGTTPLRTIPGDRDSIALLHVDLDKAKVGAFKPKGKMFRFEVQTEHGELIDTEVHAVDRHEGRDIAEFKSNQYVDITRLSGTKPLTMICGAFGYREEARIIDYNDPSHAEGATKDEHGAWVIPFKLQKLGKGDVTLMYRVFFYKDAVVMLPKSKSELDELRDLLKANDFHITVHGHCNGTYDRKIIALGNSNNYFTVTGASEIHGSAKDLTRLRAEAIRSYLASQGIPEKRMEVHAWGGSDMLVDPNNAASRINDRIEVEIMSK